MNGSDDLKLRLLSGLGFLALLGIAFLLSKDRKAIDRRAVLIGIVVQFALALFFLKGPVGEHFSNWVAVPVGALQSATAEGARFLFGDLLQVNNPGFGLTALPVIIFMGSLFGVLYHLGVIQPLVRFLSRVFARVLNISGAEALTAVANIFVGITDVAVVIRPYFAALTRSELFAFMTLGMSTIAGSVLVVYSSFLGPAYAGHLVIASLISAPAALVVAKIILPETEMPETRGLAPQMEVPKASNVIDAATQGGLVGLQLALNMGALLIAFVALIAMVNLILGGVGGWFGAPEITLQSILGVLLSPLAFIMGVPWSEAQTVGSLIGIKTIANEFVAYEQLRDAIAQGLISERSALISTYALCGFANFGSLAILLGGIEAIAPKRRPEAARLGLLSIAAGTLTTCMTGCLAGMIVS
ncbi:MAG: NupC/NupG family nucleoside CNT transporter [Myxococcota bacterium]